MEKSKLEAEKNATNFENKLKRLKEEWKKEEGGSGGNFSQAPAEGEAGWNPKQLNPTLPNWDEEEGDAGTF